MNKKKNHVGRDKIIIVSKYTDIPPELLTEIMPKVALEARILYFIIIF